MTLQMQIVNKLTATTTTVKTKSTNSAVAATAAAPVNIYFIKCLGCHLHFSISHLIILNIKSVNKNCVCTFVDCILCFYV